MQGTPGILRLTIISLTVLATLSTAPGYGLGQEFSEYEVKAAFILNIAKFIEWSDKGSPEPGDTINLCVIGSDPFGRALDQIAGKPVKGKRLHVRLLASARNVKGCSILFISSSERERLPHIMETLKNTSVLTVGDTNGYSLQGVMINFYLDGKKVRFEANPDQAKRAGLIISSQLLKLARIVRNE
jgi:hypothetical protein